MLLPTYIACTPCTAIALFSSTGEDAESLETLNLRRSWRDCQTASDLNPTSAEVHVALTLSIIILSGPSSFTLFRCFSLLRWEELNA